MEATPDTKHGLYKIDHYSRWALRGRYLSLSVSESPFLALFGHRSQSPYLAIANRQAEIMMRIASEFGFTPASRSRISAPPKDQLPLFDPAEPEG
jgi:hypothetical protein